MAASSSTSAHANNNNQRFEVFINHRGPDTKDTFARTLYLRLLENRLRAFLDKPEMQPGCKISSQIKNAITTASVHVAIFSARYAESYWCLDELLMMLESKALIIPVFYGVTPSEVRRTRGKRGRYARALKIMAKKKTDEGNLRHDSYTIERWRNALSQVADISGFELKECDIGDEKLKERLLDELVKKLLENMKKPDLYVAKFPTGLDDKLKDFEDTVPLEIEQSGIPERLGIWGAGGVGKTTVAKEFFNRKKSDYPISCFLSDVRYEATKDSLIKLQSIFLKSLTGLDKPINSVDEGTGMLQIYIDSLKRSNASLQKKQQPEESVQVNDEHAVSKGLEEESIHVDDEHRVSKVLVVLDDVDHQSQVDALLPVDLPSGSLILLTSRDKHVLLGSKVKESSIYRLVGLDKQYSRELFCSHAFNQTEPPVELEYLVDEFLMACQGLPLSLKILGANLYGRKDICDWKDELEKLKQILPSEIEAKLKISYDALDEQGKQMFLDIACFFPDIKSNVAISIWDGSGWKGRLGFRNLQEKCLVGVDSGNVIHMHDHLRDLGRNVAEKLWPRRLWHWTKEVIDDMLSQPSETVRGIHMCHDVAVSLSDTENVLPEPILRTLRILRTKGEYFPRTVELASILYLSWINYPYSSLPSGFTMKNLRLLRVSGRLLKRLQNNDIGRLAQATKLLSLHVCECSELEELPIMETLLSLEELCAYGCGKLKSIPGLEQATKLRVLNIVGCSELETLPNMERLIHLEELVTNDCVKLKRIRGLAKLANLRFLFVSGCTDLEELPSMETLKSLEKLAANGCVKLKRIRGLQQQSKLRLLSVKGCTELEELPSMETLGCLEELVADKCVKLKSIKGFEHATQLRFLDVSGCDELKELPSIETLVSLKVLWAKQCLQLKSIMGLAQATKLVSLHVCGCSELEELPSMEKLASLEDLCAKDCGKLKSIQGLEHATKLRVLDVSSSGLEELPCMETLGCLKVLQANGCVKMKNIRGLERATKLRILSISRCLQLKSIRGLAQATQLRILHVCECSELEELQSMETLVSLEELCAINCVKLKSIRGLEQATKLRILRINDCSELEELTLGCLEKLLAVRCAKLKSIRGLEQCTRLRVLSISGCRKLEEVPSMEALLSLEELWVTGLQVKSIWGLAQGIRLQILHVCNCSDLEELPSSEAWMSLEELCANNCVKLKRIRGLEKATKLRLLEINSCSELEELPSMKTLGCLEQLQAHGCVKLKSIPGLAQLAKLRRLDICGCSGLEDLPSMEGLVCLEELWAINCVKLERIIGLDHATKLQKLIVSACSGLEELPHMEALACLKELWANYCVKLKRIRGLERATKLQKLSVTGCFELEEVEGVEHMSLKMLAVSGCPRLQCPVWE